MDAVRGNRTFEDFDPAVEWSRAAEADAVKITLPGFKREEIRVLVDNHGHLRTRGERPVAGSRWSRFQKDFKLPDNCNVDGIRAKFESETLTITLPKKSPSPQVAAAPAVPAPTPPKPESIRPTAVPSQKPPAAFPEPARPAPPTVPAAPLAPASSQRLPPDPSQRQPTERRPSLPSRLPSVPTPAEVDEPIKKPETAAAAITKLKEQFNNGTKKPSLEEEKKRMEREAMGKMEEDRKMMEEQSKREETPAIPELQMARQPRPMAASRGLLVNVAVAVVVLVGITAYVWHTLRNATAGDGHGAGSYRDEM